MRSRMPVSTWLTKRKSDMLPSVWNQLMCPGSGLWSWCSRGPFSLSISKRPSNHSRTRALKFDIDPPVDHVHLVKRKRPRRRPRNDAPLGVKDSRVARAEDLVFAAVPFDDAPQVRADGRKRPEAVRRAHEQDRAPGQDHLFRAPDRYLVLAAHLFHLERRSPSHDRPEIRQGRREKPGQRRQQAAPQDQAHEIAPRDLFPVHRLCFPAVTRLYWVHNAATITRMKIQIATSACLRHRTLRRFSRIFASTERAPAVTRVFSSSILADESVCWSGFISTTPVFISSSRPPSSSTKKPSIDACFTSWLVLASCSSASPIDRAISRPSSSGAVWAWHLTQAVWKSRMSAGSTAWFPWQETHSENRPCFSSSACGLSRKYFRSFTWHLPQVVATSFTPGGTAPWLPWQLAQLATDRSFFSKSARPWTLDSYFLRASDGRLCASMSA